MSFDRYCLYKCFESKNTCLQLNQYYIVTPSVTAPGKKLSIVFAFQSSSLIQVFGWGGGGGGGGREQCQLIVFTCMFMCMLLQVKSVDRNQ